jgi:hypothetical protein
MALDRHEVVLGEPTRRAVTATDEVAAHVSGLRRQIDEDRRATPMLVDDPSPLAEEADHRLACRMAGGFFIP